MIHDASPQTQVYEEVQQWDPPSPGLRGMVPVGSMTIPAQVPSCKLPIFHRFSRATFAHA